MHTSLPGARLSLNPFQYPRGTLFTINHLPVAL